MKDVKDMPRYLYKYKSLAGDSFSHVLDSMLTGNVYFSCPLHLNDPFEGHFVFDSADKVGELLAKTDREEIQKMKSCKHPLI